jgi:hypothetical protein
VAEFRHAVILLAEFDQRKTFFQLGGSGFVSGGKILQDLVVALRGLLVVSLTELNFAEIEVAVPSEIGIGIELDVVGKFLSGEIVLVAVVIAYSVVVEDIRRRSLRLGLLLRLRLSRAAPPGFAGTTACPRVVC